MVEGCGARVIEGMGGGQVQRFREIGRRLVQGQVSARSRLFREKLMEMRFRRKVSRWQATCEGS